MKALYCYTYRIEFTRPCKPRMICSEFVIPQVSLTTQTNLNNRFLLCLPLGSVQNTYDLQCAAVKVQHISTLTAAGARAAKRQNAACAALCCAQRQSSSCALKPLKVMGFIAHAACNVMAPLRFSDCFPKPS